MPEQESTSDLFDLKMLPAWATESPHENPYANFSGDEGGDTMERERRGGRGGERRGPRPARRPEPRREGRRDERPRRPASRESGPVRREQEPRAPLPAVEVRFLPDARALESVLAQIKSGHLAYSVFSLARMFLEKPERYDVRVRAQNGTLFQLGENGPVASDRRVLENGAFALEQEKFYRTEVTQSEPIKGNFTSVARDRLSGTLLGPTNHHAYQTKLRNLYEQRFSRRMSFPDYQRQIEVVSDPEAVERWKEEARSVTTYVTLQADPAQTFSSAAETERHFRQQHLPALLRENAELTLDGVVSRQLADRALGYVIEQSWAQESRSPSKMMQELIGKFPDAGLHIFRHRKGMLFVAPVRPRAFKHDGLSISPSIGAVLNVLADAPGIKRKQLLEKMLETGATETAPNDAEAEKKKLALASDLHWLISEGHVIEFNDGSLDLARAKVPAPSSGSHQPKAAPESKTEPVPEQTEAAAPPNEIENKGPSAEVSPNSLPAVTPESPANESATSSPNESAELAPSETPDPRVETAPNDEDPPAESPLA